MLLSMYASYLWANCSKTTYILRMIVFIPLVTLLSAYIPMSDDCLWFLIMSLNPYVYAGFLSFPFYSIVHFHLDGNIRSYSIRLLTADLSFVESSGMGLYYLIQHNLWGQVRFLFSFFLLVNFLGALLGYFIAKTCRIHFLNDKQGVIFCISTAIAFIIVGGLFEGSIARVGVTFFGFGIFLLNVILFKKLILPLTRGFVQMVREIPER